MVADLKALPKLISEPMLAAWNVKEYLMDLLTLLGDQPQQAADHKLLTRFYESSAASGLPEIERLVTDPPDPT